MTRTPIAAAALLALMAAPAAAADQKTETDANSWGPMEFLASDLLDMDLYARQEGEDLGPIDRWLLDAEDDGQPFLIDQSTLEEWDDVGEIEDLVVTPDGRVDSVVVEVGGFLGIGEKRVGLPMDQIRFLRDSNTGERYVVYGGKVDNLESLPEFEDRERLRGQAEQAAATTAEPEGDEAGLPREPNPDLDVRLNNMGGRTPAQKEDVRDQQPGPMLDDE